MEKKKQTIYLAGKVNGPKWDIATACEDLASFVASDGRCHSERILRFTGTEVFQNADACAEEIQKTLSKIQ